MKNKEELDLIEIDGNIYLKMENHYVRLNDIVDKYYTFKDGKMIPLFKI